MKKLKKFPREQRLQWLGHVKSMGDERGQLQALRLQANGSKKRKTEKKMEKIAGICMIARSLQRLDVQNRERWRPGCKTD